MRLVAYCRCDKTLSTKEGSSAAARDGHPCGKIGGRRKTTVRSAVSVVARPGKVQGARAAGRYVRESCIGPFRAATRQAPAGARKPGGNGGHVVEHGIGGWRGRRCRHRWVVSCRGLRGWGMAAAVLSLAPRPRPSPAGLVLRTARRWGCGALGCCFPVWGGWTGAG